MSRSLEKEIKTNNCFWKKDMEEVEYAFNKIKYKAENPKNCWITSYFLGYLNVFRKKIARYFNRIEKNLKEAGMNLGIKFDSYHIKGEYSEDIASIELTHPFTIKSDKNFLTFKLTYNENTKGTMELFLNSPRDAKKSDFILKRLNSGKELVKQKNTAKIYYPIEFFITPDLFNLRLYTKNICEVVGNFLKDIEG